jgi:hypothetical protein
MISERHGQDSSQGFDAAFGGPFALDRDGHLAAPISVHHQGEVQCIRVRQLQAGQDGKGVLKVVNDSGTGLIRPVPAARIVHRSSSGRVKFTLRGKRWCPPYQGGVTVRSG